MKRKILFLLLSVILCMELSATFSIDIRTGITKTEAGIGIGIGRNELKIGCTSTYPNLAFHMKQEEDWQFKYYTTDMAGLLLDAFYYYNSMEVGMLFGLSGESSAVSVHLGPQLYCSHTDGKWIGIDLTETDIGINLAAVVKAHLSKHFGLSVQCGIPLAHVAFSKNQEICFSSILSDERILKEVLYSVSAGLFLEFGGGR